jgi:Cytochrome c oxidase caa3 assembly factor (Caa3_CtaG)
MIPFLLVADLQNTALSAMLAFSDRVLYRSYSAVPRLFAFSALEDQVAAGAIMWVVGSMAFALPAIVIALQCLSRASSQHRFSTHRTVEGFVATSTASGRFGLGLRWVAQRMTGKWCKAISFLVLFAAAGLCWARLASRSSDSDDLALRLTQQTGTLAVTVFSAPGDSFSRPSEFAILVQGRDSREALLDSEIKLTADKSDEWVASSTVTATHDSSNKLLQSAALNLPTVGSWLLDISVRSGLQTADLLLPLTVVNSESRGLQDYWPYFVVLAVFAVLVLAYTVRHAPDSSAQGGQHILASPPTCGVDDVIES